MNFIETFVNDLAAIRLESVFNPYIDQCQTHDGQKSPAIRRANLTAFLNVAEKLDLSSAWFGRDLGYRGGRRTGLALTDEPHLASFADIYPGAEVMRATIGPEMSERTATEVWNMLAQLPSPPFLWNIFPFHPFDSQNPMSNRAHSARERDVCADILASLLGWLKPSRLVAIGGDAARTLNKLGYSCTCIRHPSYGGKAEFVRGVSEFYGLPQAAARAAVDSRMPHMVTATKQRGASRY
jgi:hypothetical protein